MSLIQVNWHPNRKELRNFGIIALIASALAALLLFFAWKVEAKWALIVFGAGVVVFLTGLIWARLCRIIYVILTAISLPIGMAVSFTLLAVFYALLIIPLSLFFRCIGRDPLQRRRDCSAKSYWVPRQPPDHAGRYYRQF